MIALHAPLISDALQKVKMATTHPSDKIKQVSALIANLDDKQLSSLEAALKEVASDGNARVQAASSDEQALTPEEGCILQEAFNSPAREPSARMLEAVANYKRIMSETL